MKQALKHLSIILSLIVLMAVVSMGIFACKPDNPTPGPEPTPGPTPGPEKTEYTIKFVTNNDEEDISITKKEGESLSGLLPTFGNTDEYYFGGWYTSNNFSGDAVALPEKMPASDTTYYAQWYRTYKIEKYLQKVTLDGYEATAADVIEGRIIKGQTLSSEVTRFLHEDPEGFKIHIEGDLTEDDIRTFELTAKDNYLRLDFDRRSYKIKFDANLADAQGEMESVEVVYGQQYDLEESCDYTATYYLFVGWASDAEGNDRITSVTMPAADVTVYAVWSRGLEDVFGGFDCIFLSENEPDIAYLRKNGFDELIEGKYDATSLVFDFGKDGETILTGKVANDERTLFYYFKDLWQKRYTNDEGAILELKARGEAALYESEDADAVNGSYAVDVETGLFKLTLPTTTYLFDIDAEESAFRFSGSENGWYALSLEDGEYGYDLLRLDGFGNLSVYALSPYDDNFDAYFDVYRGTYEIGANGIYTAYYLYGPYSYTFPFKLDYFDSAKDFEGVGIRGTYVFGDYCGSYVNLDNEYEYLELDGFGKGNYCGKSGSYTVEEDTWLVDNYPVPGNFTTSNVHFVSDDESVDKLFSIYADTYLEITEVYGRYEFITPPTSLYAGSSGEVAFMYLHGYSLYGMYGDINYAEIWFGNYTPKYSVSGYEDDDLPLYDWRDDGIVVLTDRDGVYRYESDYGETSFEFTITDDGKIQWQVSEEDTVIYNENDEKIYIDKFGVAYYEKASKKTQIEYGVLSFMRSDTMATTGIDDYSLLVLYSFIIDGEYRSFVYYAEMEAIYDSNGVLSDFREGERIEDIKEVEFVATMGQAGLLIVYPDNSVDIGLNLALFGSTGYWYCMTGTLSDVEGGHLLTVDGEPPQGESDDESETYEYLYEFFNNFRFKIGNLDEGIYECFEWNGLVLDIEDSYFLRLKTDGYGFAEFDGFEFCTYSVVREISENEILLYVSFEEGDDLYDWYLVVDTQNNTFREAENFPGTFYTFDMSTGELSSTDILVFDGEGYASGYYMGYMFEGTYEETGEELSADNMTFTEFEISVITYLGELELTSFKVISAYLSNDAHIGIYYIKEEAAEGQFAIIEGGEVVGALVGTGYGAALLELYDQEFSVQMYIGSDVDSYRTNADGEREFNVDAKGNVVLVMVQIDEFTALELVFDFVSGTTQGMRNIELREQEYGAFLEYNENGEFGDKYIKLDGHGKASICSVADASVLNTYNYELIDEDLAAFRIFDDSGETVFMFNVSITENSDDLDENYGFVYTYHLYNEKYDNVYATENWEVLILNGFGYAEYYNKYGELTVYEYTIINDTELKLHPYYEGKDVYIALDDNTFSVINRQFIVSDEGVLLAYNGEDGSVSLPDEVKRIPEGVFDGFEITHVDFNKVEVVDKNAFSGQKLDGVDAPNLRIIGERAFATMGGYDFEEVIIPAAVEIGEAAFIGNNYLELVVLRDIQTIGSQAFAGSGPSYGKLILDMKLVENPTAVTIPDDAFLALNTDNLFILVNGVETLNGIITAESWPDKAMNAACIWQSKESYKSAIYLVGLNDGVVYEFDGGILTRIYTEDGEQKSEIFGIYEFDEGEDEYEDGKMLSVYLKNGKTYSTQAIIVDTNGAYVLALGSSFAFSNVGYDEYHILTDGNKSIKFSLNFYSLSSGIQITDFFYNDGESEEVEASDIVNKDGKILFSIGEIRYSAAITSTTTCTIEQIGSAEEISVTYKNTEYLFKLVTKDGAVTDVIDVQSKNSYGGYSSESIYSYSIEDFGINIILGTDQRKEFKVTYTAAIGGGASSLKMEFVKAYARFANFNYDYPTCLNVSVELDENNKITAVTEFSFVEGYGGTPEPQEFTFTCNDDGTADVKTAEKGSFRLTVTYDDRYQLEVAAI